MGLSQKAVALTSRKIVSRGWNSIPCWKPWQHPQWERWARGVTGRAVGCCTVSWKLPGDGICVLELPCTKKSWLCWPSGIAKNTNVTQVVLWALEVMKHWRHWILWCLVKGVSLFSHQVSLLSPAACSPPGGRQGLGKPMTSHRLFGWWWGPHHNFLSMVHTAATCAFCLQSRPD